MKILGVVLFSGLFYAGVWFLATGIRDRDEEVWASGLLLMAASAALIYNVLT